MKKSDVYEVAIKILGLYLISNLVSCIYVLISSIQMFSITATLRMDMPEHENTHSFYFLFLQLIPPISNMIVNIVLILFFLFRSKWIVKRICKPSEFEEDVKLFAKKNEIYQIAITISCLILVLWTLPDLAFKLEKYISNVQNDQQNKVFETVFVSTSLVKVLVGIIGIYFSRTLADFFAKERKAKEALNNLDDLNK